MSSPIAEMALSPRLTMTVCSIPMEICPTATAAAIISSAKNTRLYSTRSRTASRNVFHATTPARFISRSPPPPMPARGPPPPNS